uniref:Uncharacterized protein n=1 Tax=Anguilla anguilla TaxID=7936 RepID=A0A0E9WCJ2_ANGAN
MHVCGILMLFLMLMYDVKVMCVTSLFYIKVLVDLKWLQGFLGFSILRNRGCLGLCCV